MAWVKEELLCTLASDSFIFTNASKSKDNEKFLLRSFNTVKKGRINRCGGRVALLIKDRIRCTIIDNLYNANNKLEIWAVNIFISNRPITVVSIYKSPNVSISQDEITRTFFAQFHNEFIIDGNLNSHHTLWGNSKSCKEGTKLFKIIDDLGYQCLNDESLTRISQFQTLLTWLFLTIMYS